MAYLIGTVDDSNGQLAHHNLLQVIHDFTSANGWEVLRYKTDIENRELVIKGTGYSKKEEIYLYFHTYHSVDWDVYNLAVGTAIGYVPGNSINTQPKVIFSGVPAHNRRIDYWFTLNPQRFAGVLKVGTPVYGSFYIGKFLAYAPPNQYPLPLVCGGMLNGASGTRFSHPGYSIPYKQGYPLSNEPKTLDMFFNDGSWLKPYVWPWYNPNLTGEKTHLRPVNGYVLLEIILMSNKDIYGELEGVYQITGFDNTVENTLEIDGETYVVIQDAARTGPNDYYALKMEA